MRTMLLILVVLTIVSATDVCATEYVEKVVNLPPGQSVVVSDTVRTGGEEYPMIRIKVEMPPPIVTFSWVDMPVPGAPEEIPGHQIFMYSLEMPATAIPRSFDFDIVYEWYFVDFGEASEGGEVLFQVHEDSVTRIRVTVEPTVGPTEVSTSCWGKIKTMFR